jgi:hypothetical protein
MAGGAAAVGLGEDQALHSKLEVAFEAEVEAAVGGGGGCEKVESISRSRAAGTRGQASEFDLKLEPAFEARIAVAAPFAPASHAAPAGAAAAAPDLALYVGVGAVEVAASQSLASAAAAAAAVAAVLGLPPSKRLDERL